MFIALCIDSTHFVTPGVNSRPDVVANLARALKPFLLSPGQRRWIGKTPVHSVSYTGKDRTFLSAGFIANGYDISKKLAALKNIKNGLCLVVRNVDADFVHHLNSQWIKLPGFKAGTLCFEIIAANIV